MWWRYWGPCLAHISVPTASSLPVYDAKSLSAFRKSSRTHTACELCVHAATNCCFPDMLRLPRVQLVSLVLHTLLFCVCRESQLQNYQRRKRLQETLGTRPVCSPLRAGKYIRGRQLMCICHSAEAQCA